MVNNINELLKSPPYDFLRNNENLGKILFFLDMAEVTLME